MEYASDFRRPCPSRPLLLVFLLNRDQSVSFFSVPFNSLVLEIWSPSKPFAAASAMVSYVARLARNGSGMYGQGVTVFK